jgi:hypothetical protein
MEKPISVQVSPPGPAPRARACAPSAPDRWTPRVGASPHAPSLPISLSLLCGAGYRRRFFSHSLILSICPMDPTGQPIRNLPPMPPPSTRPRPRVFRPPPHALAPLEHVPRSPTSPAHLRPQPSTLALSLSPYAHPGSSTAAHRLSPLILRSSWDSPPRMLPR